MKWKIGLLVGLISLFMFAVVGNAQVVPTTETEASGDVVAANTGVNVPLDTEATGKAAIVPNPDEDLGGVLKMLIEAFQGGQWFVFGGLILMIIVWTIGKFLNVNSTWLPIITAGSGMLIAVVSSLVGGKIWYEAIYYGLLTSGQAALFWSLFGKKVLPTKTDEEKIAIKAEKKDLSA